jgi:hypothetical protein
LQTFEPTIKINHVRFSGRAHSSLDTSMVKLAPCWVALAAASATVAVTSALPMMAPSKGPTGLLVDFQKSPGQGIRLTPDFSCECRSCTPRDFRTLINFVCMLLGIHCMWADHLRCVHCGAQFRFSSVWEPHNHACERIDSAPLSPHSWMHSQKPIWSQLLTTVVRTRASEVGQSRIW